MISKSRSASSAVGNKKAFSLDLEILRVISDLQFSGSWFQLCGGIKTECGLSLFSLIEGRKVGLSQMTSGILVAADQEQI